LYEGVEFAGGQLGLKIGIDLERVGQSALVFGPVDFDGSELAQMIGQELAVEQNIATFAKPGCQVAERDLAGVTRAGEHAFAEERATQ